MCNSSDVRLRCPLYPHAIRPQRCTEVLLERFGVFPRTHLPGIMARTGLALEEIDRVCSACPLNPVEEPVHEAVRVVNDSPPLEGYPSDDRAIKPAADTRRRRKRASKASSPDDLAAVPTASSNYMAGFQRSRGATRDR